MKDIYTLVEECRENKDCMKHVITFQSLFEVGLIHFRNIKKTGRIIFFDKDMYYFMIAYGGHADLFDLDENAIYNIKDFDGKDEVDPEVHGRKVSFEDIHVNLVPDSCYWKGEWDDIIETLDIFCNMIEEAEK
jgi:hypothetical protein